MGQLRFLSREKLIGYLEDELNIILNDLELYEISNYGWLENGNHDPEYPGHAAWQFNPPELPKLASIGLEFTNLMHSSLHSLGLAYLYHEPDASTVHDHRDGFSFYFTDTANKLNLATDRIRDFLITAFVRQAPWGARSWPVAGKVFRGEGFSSNFLNPFRQIQEEVETWADGNTELGECLAKLQPMADEIARCRNRYQNPVCFLNLFIDRLANAVANLESGYADDALAGPSVSQDGSLLGGLRSWYQLLVETSNQVFLAEHLLRGLSREIGIISPQSPQQQIM